DYTAIVEEITSDNPNYKGRILEIESIVEKPPLSQNVIALWRWMADYYMCTTGEVYRAAFPTASFSQTVKRVKKRAASADKEPELPNELSDKQKSAYNKITGQLSAGVTTLLKGVTGSGKTEIYITLAEEVLRSGRNVLYMLPEIALSRQLSHRLEKIFREQLLVYHSGQTASERRSVFEKIMEGSGPYIVLGLRSAVFLPFNSLGLVIIDEEHDSSYKQNEPSPRYNGHDTALVLAKLFNAGVVMGSATPSLESLYNTISGRYSLVELNEKYYSDHSPRVEIIDTIREEKRGQMEGIFSRKTISAIEDCIKNGEQVLIFRNRRSYSPFVQCIYCGHIPMCASCNVSVSYHKSKGVLTCHYCGQSIRFNTICTKCGKPGLKERGSGTEMAEEQIANLLPEARIARFDAETTQSRSEQKRIIREFANGELDILVGTQMLSKGFDFSKLNLIVIIHADSMFSAEDFRAGERALQMLTQLAGRGGRRDKEASVIIQTAQPDNNIYRMFIEGNDDFGTELSERKEFGYPPYVRLIKVIVKNKSIAELNKFATKYTDYLNTADSIHFTGPFAPPVDIVRGEHILNFLIKLPRSKDVRSVKRALYDHTVKMVKNEGHGLKLWFDVDPY
ncbi:MAG TPA: primosomal protein N', partial [Rikenellaceae bacterium]|nr:primosomal protein N' [Rikenellaceae bacterium]